MNDMTYRVHGMMQSYFTRKMTGYLDYKGIPWRFRRFPGASPEVMAAGFPGGVPAVQTPDGAFMWDSTAMIHHLELRFPTSAVLPEDPVQRFLCYVLEDVADEWFYRPAVGTRWHFAENAAVGGFELARDIAARAALSCDQAYAAVAAHVRSSCPPLGVTADNIQHWVDAVLRPWMRVLGAHLAGRPYLFGARPSLADFALFGGNAAHFVNDPLCRRWVEEDTPAVVQHTHRLLEPDAQEFGAWDEPGDIPETLVTLLADLGRVYLPWVSRACVDGNADVVFAPGTRTTVRATEFLRHRFRPDSLLAIRLGMGEAECAPKLRDRIRRDHLVVDGGREHRAERPVDDADCPGVEAGAQLGEQEVLHLGAAEATYRDGAEVRLDV